MTATVVGKVARTIAASLPIKSSGNNSKAFKEIGAAGVHVSLAACLPALLRAGHAACPAEQGASVPEHLIALPQSSSLTTTPATTTTPWQAFAEVVDAMEDAARLVLRTSSHAATAIIHHK